MENADLSDSDLEQSILQKFLNVINDFLFLTFQQRLYRSWLKHSPNWSDQQRRWTIRTFDFDQILFYFFFLK